MKSETTALEVQTPGLSVGRWREATDVANLCKEIVAKSAVDIAGRKYVKVEGWTTIAVAHGCIASVKPDSVVEVFRDGKLIGIKAVAQIKRQVDGVVLTEAEGFVGDDEETWFGSHGEKRMRWNKYKKKEEEVVIPKRDDYAIRSMAQTRAVAKACRNAFSHVVVLMDKGLSTTPFEEISGSEDADFDAQKPERRAEPATDDAPPSETQPASASKTKPVEVPRDEVTKLEKQFEEGKWEKVAVHFGNYRGTKLIDLEAPQLAWYCFTWKGCGPEAVRPPTEDDKLLRAACNVAIRELALKEPPPHN